MKEYEILDGVKVKLNKVTPKALKNLKNAGIDFTSDNPAELGRTVIRIFAAEEEKLKAIVETIFDYQVTGVELVDLSVVQDGLADFFLQLTGLSQR